MGAEELGVKELGVRELGVRELGVRDAGPGGVSNEGLPAPEPEPIVVPSYKEQNAAFKLQNYFRRRVIIKEF